ncbi:Vid27p KNAG_0F00990 [Huiozyma naganishii CBS 8797]|uniref:Vacuolar import/degradation Vid27 C-terminal domain-containing protein n=1 Tax=Huiozyma naganishii (strain ATCC MYA-139 / BCRC 22969 / CBS 8797 / KCTC 17520 / NBRC 10181 / NCYC 3082 / Yp74L-3) TaxID=1071383 RepID=J7RMI2_HUIN7|nr:hypothetical protein KNAG_0F00990 [Kazachstania naganishii CBS 8797]CCK70768.1 hypothetical protein KNAG_0F00990 [Kazachstania naganishii CBS 8797]
MNILKKFMDSGKKESVLCFLPSGEFDLLRGEQSPKSSLECIHNDAALLIWSRGRLQYDLVVRKAIDEAEAGNDVGDNSDFSDDAISILSVQSKKKEEDSIFHLSPKLNIKKTWSKNGEAALTWNNLAGDEPDEKVQFVLSNEIPLKDMDNFLQVLYSCLFEVLNQKPAKLATDNEIKDIELLVNTMTDDGTEELSNKLQNLFVVDDSAEEDDEDDSNDNFVDAKENAVKSKKAKKPFGREQNIPQGKQLCLIEADLHLFDPIQELFILQEQPINVSLIETGKYQYWLSMEGKEIRLGTNVSPNVNPTLDDNKLGFIFNYTFENITLSYMLKFLSVSEYKSFKMEWTSCLWMFLNREPWEKVSEMERQYIVNAESTNLIKDLDEILGFGDDARRESAEDEDTESSEEEEEEKGHKKRSVLISSESFGETPSSKSSSGNKSLTVSYRNNRSYILRGDKIGVFKTVDDDDDSGLEFVSVIKNVSNADGKKIDPKNPMMYMEDRSIILSDDKNLNRLYKLDIERGKVIEEWGTGDKNVVQYGPSKKYDQLTAEQTVLGISDKALFKIDPRINDENKIVQDQSKEYASRNKFSSVGTTEGGYIAVGSEKGDIRLYDRFGIRAKTSIPSLGQPIRHICTSGDGRWLLATCDSSLLLMDLTVKTGKNAGNIGFLKSFPSTENVKTYILKISPEHASYMVTYTKKPIKFSKAYFNAGVGQVEQTIVTSTGPFAISWSLDKILSGSAKPYTVNRYRSDVVEDNFEYGTDKKIIVALKDDVSLSKIKSFKNPSKMVLMPENNINDFYE